MKNDKTSILFALGAVLIWSTIASAFKLTLSVFTPQHMVFYSSITATLVFLLISILKKTPVFKISKKDIIFSSFAGMLNPFIYYLLLLKGYEILPAQSAQAINYSWSVSLSIMSFIFLKQKPMKRDILSILICYFGVFLIATKGKFQINDLQEINGICFVLASTIVWASYWILNTKDKLEPELRLFWNFTFGLFYSFVYIMIFDDFNLNVKGISGSIYIGFFEMGISFFLWFMAMKLTTNASRINNLIYLSPIISLFFINKLIGEKIIASTIIGLSCIITGILIQNFKRKNESGKSGIGS